MLQDMDNMEASCIFHVMVGIFTHLERNKPSLLSVNTMGIVRLTLKHDLIDSVSFMYYSGDNLKQTSAHILSLEQCPIYSYQICDFGCHTLQFIPVNNQTTLDRLIAHFRVVGNLCNLPLYAAGLIWSITNMFAANYSILT